MNVQPIATSLIEYAGEALALGVFETDIQLNEDNNIQLTNTTLQQLDERLEGELSDLVARQNFRGDVNSTVSTWLGRSSPVRQLIVVGLGQDTLKLDNVRRAAAEIVRIAKKEKCQTLGISLPLWNNAPEQTAQAIVEGVILTLHQDTRFKSSNDDQNTQLQRVDLLGLVGQEEAIASAKAICSGVILARELVAAPANICTPLTMASTAQALASEYGIQLEILEQEECERLGMGAFLGVAQASDIPPKFIHLTYQPEGKANLKKLAIIGKGLTFDSGGLNLKIPNLGVSSGIDTMKMDMGGAAATFGAAKAIGQLKPDVEVHFISAVTENMISGRAMRPGDILTASNGKKIEIDNTDAEGRLTLADALVFAEKLGVDAIVDLATLTGACIIALGDNIAGMWSSNDVLAQQLHLASELSGEQLWQMPMEEKYFSLLKSPIADMKNAGSRKAGSITAALFLKQFVKETPWAHLDIAGPAWLEKEDSYNNEGATGFGVRMLVNWVLSNTQEPLSNMDA